jgi:hypothetical protein
MAAAPTSTSGWYCTNFRSFTVAAVSRARINRLSRPRAMADLGISKDQLDELLALPEGCPAGGFPQVGACGFEQLVVKRPGPRPRSPARATSLPPRTGRAHTKWSAAHLLAGGPLVVNAAWRLPLGTDVAILLGVIDEVLTIPTAAMIGGRPTGDAGGHAAVGAGREGGHRGRAGVRHYLLWWGPNRDMVLIENCRAVPAHRGGWPGPRSPPSQSGIGHRPRPGAPCASGGPAGEVSG